MRSEDPSLDTNLLGNLPTSIQLQSEERLKELEDKRELGKFSKRLKCCGYFFIFFSTFLLLNACVGFSSAPFYLPKVDCNPFEPSEECLSLKTVTSAMYSVELAGALLMIVHGLLLIAILDHIRSLRFIKLVQTFTKFLFGAYAILIVLRISLYFKVRADALDHDVYN